MSLPVQEIKTEIEEEEEKMEEVTTKEVKKEIEEEEEKIEEVKPKEVKKEIKEKEIKTLAQVLSPLKNKKNGPFTVVFTVDVLSECQRLIKHLLKHGKTDIRLATQNSIKCEGCMETVNFPVPIRPFNFPETEEPDDILNLLDIWNNGPVNVSDLLRERDIRQMAKEQAEAEKKEQENFVESFLPPGDDPEDAEVDRLLAEMGEKNSLDGYSDDKNSTYLHSSPYKRPPTPEAVRKMAEDFDLMEETCRGPFLYCRPAYTSSYMHFVRKLLKGESFEGSRYTPYPKPLPKYPTLDVTLKKPPRPVLRCKLCGKQICFVKKDRHQKSIRMHTVQHIDFDTFKCRLCPKTFRTFTLIRNHLFEYHGFKKYTKIKLHNYGTIKQEMTPFEAAIFEAKFVECFGNAEERMKNSVVA